MFCEVENFKHAVTAQGWSAWHFFCDLFLMHPEIFKLHNVSACKSLEGYGE
jgi:hypothetical protein